MSNAITRQAIELDEIPPARSRHAGRRSTVELADRLVVVGTTTGEVHAYDRTSLEERWRAHPGTESTAVVSAVSFGDSVVVGERGPAGALRCYDIDTGDQRWRYATATDVGTPQKPSRFFRPFVVDLTTGGDRLYAAARRYERDGDTRSFTSVVYALNESGDIVWTYETDASPISLDVCGHRLGIAYNRCPGIHQRGLVVLDTETGTERYDWDPGTDGQRRVGDVSLVGDDVVVTSHGDYRGYRLRDGGSKQWSVDLATPVTIDGEAVYAYPNHVHATADRVFFLTGNTYSTDGRETGALHPDEHTAFGYTQDGRCMWTASVGGFANDLGVDGEHVAVPGAQHFRTRDVDVHGLRLIDTKTGSNRTLKTDGIVTAVTLDGERFAAVEEPVVYHDDGEQRGAYRVVVGSSENR
ncbi:MAG: PQQ-binding-like beta-propeller repeat protein [Halobacteriales archaeon]|nr:PQQ-binding-like beta-propeller repeat protein [Halobacteriales archaeon]